MTENTKEKAEVEIVSRDENGRRTGGGLYALFSQAEKRNIIVYTIGIMFFKFGFESIKSAQFKS